MKLRYSPTGQVRSSCKVLTEPPSCRFANLQVDVKDDEKDAQVPGRRMAHGLVGRNVEVDHRAEYASRAKGGRGANNDVAETCTPSDGTEVVIFPRWKNDKIVR
ncbi:hypothetical protein MRX96_005483 [Rhipicephalus microplus]